MPDAATADTPATTDTPATAPRPTGTRDLLRLPDPAQPDEGGLLAALHPLPQIERLGACTGPDAEAGQFGAVMGHLTLGGERDASDRPVGGQRECRHWRFLPP